MLAGLGVPDMDADLRQGWQSIDVVPVPDASGTARFPIVRTADSRHPAGGIRIEIWG